MSGYANRTVRLDFPEFTAPGEPEVHVVIRNPKIMPQHKLVRRDVTAEQRAVNPEADWLASYELLSRLIISWHVYDTTSDDPEQPLLGLPATEESVAKLPQRITDAIATKIVEAQNPGAGA